jgi:hypothetical protein
MQKMLPLALFEDVEIQFPKHLVVNWASGIGLEFKKSEYCPLILKIEYTIFQELPNGT